MCIAARQGCDLAEKEINLKYFPTITPLSRQEDELRTVVLKRSADSSIPTASQVAGSSVAKRPKNTKSAKTSTAAAGPSSTQPSLSKVTTRSSRTRLAAPDMEVRSVSDSSISAMKTSIGRLGLEPTPPAVVAERSQASGSRVNIQGEGFNVDTFFPSLAPYSFDPNGPRPPTWQIDAATARLEYLKTVEQHLARPIQDMIDRRADTIDKMIAEWNSLIPPPRVGYQEEGIQASGKGKGKRRASPVEEEVVDVEDDVEEVEPDFEEFEAAPEENFEELEEIGPQDVEMGQENVEEAQSETAS